MTQAESRSVVGAEEGQEKADHARRGRRGTGAEQSAGQAGSQRVSGERLFAMAESDTGGAEPASGDDAQRRLDQQYDLAALLSHGETRQVKNDYTVQFEGRR
jgi:hypothetical protein